ncbi:MAG: flagellar hook-basal body protein [Gorillibacterium sp.]|nr:flagellar hook-basal body protein [Gorillibacterium sp.]
MIRGLYTAAAGMIAEQRKHDTVTNNIANLNTTGFKQVNAISRSFPEMLIALTNGDPGQKKTIGKLNSGVMAEEDPSLNVQGNLLETKNDFDFAIASDIQEAGLDFEGSGMAFNADGERVFQKQIFFTLQNESGETRYTRSGNFTASDTGELITPAGFKVVGLNGEPIQLSNPTTGQTLSQFTVTADGRFTDSATGKPLLDAAGREVGMMLSRVDNPNRLVREGSGVYRISADEEGTVTALADDANGRNIELGQLVDNHQVALRQGYVEGSNVDAAQSMIDMNTALRAYEANQKVIQYYDRSLDKAVNEVGRV